MRARILVAAAGIAVASLALGACASDPAANSANPEALNPGLSSGEQREAFAEIYNQEIEWGECDSRFGLSPDLKELLIAKKAPVDAFQCAMIAAPLDWNDPTNEATIELAIAQVAASAEQKLGLLTSNPGGPGASGLGLFYSFTAQPDFAEVMAGYDFLGFDPRGIGGSTPLSCADYSNIEAVQLAVCAEEEPLAKFMGTSQVARDMDLMRELLNEEKLNYLGYSYGTILGATYSTLFAERVGRMVLDSAPDNTWASLKSTYTQSVAIAAEIVSMFAECESTYHVAHCPIKTEAAFVAVLEQLNDEPLVASNGQQVSGADLYSYMLDALYTRAAGRTEALDTVGRALAGDQEQIDDLAQAVNNTMASVSFGGQVISCHSMPQDPDVIALLEAIEEKGVPLLLGGPEITEEMVQDFTNISCLALPGSGNDLFAFSAPKGNAILMLGITGDHATPFDEGKALAAQLGNTRFLTVEGHGHAASFAGFSSCASEAVSKFLLTGELPPEGTTCKAD